MVKRQNPSRQAASQHRGALNTVFIPGAVSGSVLEARQQRSAIWSGSRRFYAPAPGPAVSLAVPPNPSLAKMDLCGLCLFVAGELKPNLEPFGIRPVDQERFAAITFDFNVGCAVRLFVIFHVGTVARSRKDVSRGAYPKYPKTEGSRGRPPQGALVGKQRICRPDAIMQDVASLAGVFLSEIALARISPKSVCEY